ncbi:MAG TPA: hypothetical protein VEU96_30625 [Bryobacteraceae bacterium]|nr:hypothetical protein [Bryobacteraceae bacterium]
MQFQDLEAARSIEFAGAILPWNYAVTGSDGVRMVYTICATPDLIPLLQIRPAVGRTRTRADFDTHTVVLGYDYWRSLWSAG